MTTTTTTTATAVAGAEEDEEEEEKKKERELLFQSRSSSRNHGPANCADRHVSVSPTPEHASAPRSLRSQRHTSHFQLNPLQMQRATPLELKSEPIYLSIHPSINQSIYRFTRVLVTIIIGPMANPGKNERDQRHHATVKTKQAKCIRDRCNRKRTIHGWTHLKRTGKRAIRKIMPSELTYTVSIDGAGDSLKL